MPATLRSPLADFRLTSYPSATAQATVTNTAGNETVYVTGTQTYQKLPVVMTLSATLSAGATAQTPIRLNLIDGTSGGTPLRSWALSAPANQTCVIQESDLNIKCFSGLATLEFAGTSLAATQQAVNLSGFTTSYGEN